MKYVLLLILIIFASCNVSRIETASNSCCKSLYDVLYLSQKSPQKPEVGSLLDCCRTMNKYQFCADRPENERQRCLDLMKSF